jgi:CheY-like chemotaxis protein
MGAATATPNNSAFTPLPALRQWPGTPVLAGRKLLVVDDDPLGVYGLWVFLKRIGIKVVPAERGEHGIALLEQIPDVDLVLVDIMMPGLDGYATMRAMRGLPEGNTVPLVACTAKLQDGERRRCIDAGASAYLPKPIDKTQFLAILDEWLPDGS